MKETMYDQANAARRGRLDKELLSRRERGDSLDDITFWVRRVTPVKPSKEEVRTWCRLAVLRAELAEARGE